MRTYGGLRRDADSWVVSGLEPHVAIRFKDNFKKVPRHSTGPFRLLADGVTAADLAWFISRFPLAASPRDLEALSGARAGYEAMQAETGRILSPTYIPPAYPGLRPGQVVRQHQGQAAEILHRFGGLLVTDDVGEGKTYTGGACLLLPGALPATVVCPPHLARQWADKLREFTTLSTYIIPGTRPRPLPPADVRIFSYSNLAGWVDFLKTMGTGVAIFDEAHHLRHGLDTDKGKAAAALVAVSRLKLLMTATPIFNYGDEIWNVLQFARPEVLGDRADFMREWCGGTLQVSDPAALGSYLYDQKAMIRKRGTAPEPNVIVHTIGHDVRALASVEALAHTLALKARDGLAEERGHAIRQLDMLLRMQTGVAKAKTVAAYVRILVEGGEPVTLFGWHRAVYKIWLKELADFNPVLYTGTESPAQKAAAAQAFIERRAGVFIMSLRSGEGLDGIQAVSRHAVIGELDWSPSTHKQNIGRLNREGQPCWPDPVTAHYLVADDGSDPAIQDVLGLKASQSHGIVDPGLRVQAGSRDSSPLERLVERYIARSQEAA